MSIETNLNVSPYFDDFSANNNFNRILFKPGTAVQARELTQSQSILQDQIEKAQLGLGLVEGSIISGGELIFNTRKNSATLKFIKLADSNANGDVVTVDNFLKGNTTIFSHSADATVAANNKISAKVLAVADGAQASNPNLKTLLVKYINSGSANNSTAEFKAGDLIMMPDGTGTNIFARVANASFTPIGNASSVFVDSGVLYAKGNFINIPQQTLIIDKYTDVPTVQVGFEVNETIVKAASDPSLNDPASGTTNFNAPGADRLKITATLKSKPYNSNNSILGANSKPFFSVAKLQGGEVVKHSMSSLERAYDAIGDRLATRTYEESGDYILTPIKVRVREHLNDLSNEGVFRTSGDGIVGDSNKLAVELEECVAYIGGRRVKINATRRVEIEKAREFETLNNQITSTTFGNYFLVKNLCGAINVKEGAAVSLRSSAQRGPLETDFGGKAVTGTQIGTANVVSIEYHSGSSEESILSGGAEANTNFFKVFLTNITPVTSDFNAQKVKGIFIKEGGGSGVNTLADTVLDSNGDAELKESNLSRLYFDLGTEATKTVKSGGSTDISFFFKYTSNTQFSTSGISEFPLPSIPIGGTDTFEIGTANRNASTSELRNFIISTKVAAKTADLVSQWSGTMAIAVGSNTAVCGGDPRNFLKPGDLIEIANSSGTIATRYISTVTSTNFTVVGSAQISGIQIGNNTTVKKVYPKGYIFDLTKTSSKNGTREVNFNISSGRTKIDLKETFESAVACDVTFNMRRNNAQPATKSVRRDRITKIDTTTADNKAIGPWSLGVPDVFKIKEIYVGDTFTTSGVNRVKDFDLLRNDSPGIYKNSEIRLRPGRAVSASDKLTVIYDYFEHANSGGLGFFAVDSYPINDNNTTFNINTEINTAEIPLSYDTGSGRIFDLRNMIDFRRTTVRQANAAATTLSNAKVINTSNTRMRHNSSASIQGLMIPVNNTTFSADVEDFLPRIDSVFLTKDGELIIKKGASSRSPIAPPAISGAMLINTIRINPFPSLSLPAARKFQRFDLAIKQSQTLQKRYTMKSIGSLEKRIGRLEYYGALNLLEQAAKNMNIKDANGDDRFKNGFFADPFLGHNNADTSSPLYNIANHRAKGEMRPRFDRAFVDLKVNESTSNNMVIRPDDQIITVPVSDIQNWKKGAQVFKGTTFPGTASGTIYAVANTAGAFGTSQNYRVYLESTSGNFAASDSIKRKNGSNSHTVASVERPPKGTVATLEYSHDLVAEQPYATKIRNPVQELEFNWAGEIRLYPDSDFFEDITHNPDIVNEIDLYTPLKHVADTIGVQYDQFIPTGEVVTSVTVLDEVEGDRFRVGGDFVATDGTTGLLAIETTITEEVTSTQEFERTGTELEVLPNNSTLDLGTYVTDINIIEFIRPRNIDFFGFRMRPNTRVYPYFDEEPVSDFVIPTQDPGDSFTNLGSDGGFINATSSSLGSALTTDSRGRVFGKFRIPGGPDSNVRFRTGKKQFQLYDVDNLVTKREAVTTSAIGEYTSQGIAYAKNKIVLDVKEGQTQVNQVSKDNPGQYSSIEDFTKTEVSTDIRIRRETTAWDPLAQSFIVPDTFYGGMFLSKIDLYFAQKSEEFGVTVQIREMENGTITNKIVPYGSITLGPSQINVDATGTNDVATPVIFPTSVYLDQSREYAFVIMPEANSPDFRVWVAELGGIDVGSGELIASQPSVGVMFVSSNDRTYKPIMNEDVKFNLYRAKYDISKTGKMFFENESSEFLKFSNTENGVMVAGEKVRGASSLLIANTRLVTQGGISYAGQTNSSNIPVGATVEGITSKSKGKVKKIVLNKFGNTVAANTGTILVDSANAFTAGEQLRIRWGGDSGYGNNVIATLSSSHTPNTTTGFVRYYNSQQGKMTINAVSGSFAAIGGGLGFGFLRGQVSNVSVQVVRLTDNKFNEVIPKVVFTEPPRTEAIFDQKTHSNTFVVSSNPTFEPVYLTKVNRFSSERIIGGKTSEAANIGGGKSYQLRAKFTSEVDRLSPRLDTSVGFGLSTLKNRLKAETTENLLQEIDPSQDSGHSRYISKVVNLADGMDADDIQVKITGYRPHNSDIRTYVRFKSKEDPDNIALKHFTQLNIQSVSNNFSSSSNLGDLREYTFNMPTSNASLFTAFLDEGNNNVLKYTSNTAPFPSYHTFKQFQIKVVLTGEDSASIPRLADLRAIALQTGGTN